MPIKNTNNTSRTLYIYIHTHTHKHTHTHTHIHITQNATNIQQKQIVTIMYQYHLFISVDPYRIRNPYGYGKWSHNHRAYKTIKTIFVCLAPYKLFDILR